ncbi:MAG: biotin/lipoyl-containing protein [Gemmatimonadota bacterium]
MRRYELEINGKAFTITVRDFSAGKAELEIDGTVYTVRVDDVVTEGRPSPIQPKRRLSEPASEPAASAVPAAGPEGTVTAPIPGQVLEIKVSEGEKVQDGQPLLVMEAMKMENVITSPANGTVGKILVNTGDAVAQGRELMVIV